jgi:RND family efflux transporter MFP subunit
MKKRIFVLGAVAVLLAVGGIWWAGIWKWPGANAQSAQSGQPQQSGGRRAQGRGAAPGEIVPVELGIAVKKRVPVRVELLGTVTPMASVSIKTRIDTEIVGVHFADGAVVKQGDLLFTMDSRALEAQLRQVQGTLAKDRAALEGAERDVRRYSELLAKGATTQLNLDNSTTQANSLRGTVAADESAVENLKVQISYCSIRAPITGRASMATLKVGNFVRAADATPLATIIQAAPVYITFPLPQRSLPDLRHGLAANTASIEASVPGDSRRASGQVTMIENTVDAVTGTVPVRATMPNQDELLWPGTLVTVRLNFRDEEAVTVPSAAVQVSQAGPYVYVVKNNVATLQPITVGRVVESETVIASGLEGGEPVVTTGHLLLTNGSQVVVRDAKAGS